MSYAFSVAFEKNATEKRTILKITETGTSATSEWNTLGVVGIPRSGTIVHFVSTLTGGSGTTVQPKLGRAASWAVSGVDHIAQRDTATAYHNSSVPVNYTFDPGQALVLYGCSVVNSGTNNAITTVITIIETSGEE